MKRSGTRRERFAWLAVGGGLATVGFLGCVDLFHSTDFGAGGGGCAVEAGGSGCADGASGGDGAKGRDAGADGRVGGGDGGHVGEGGARDGTTDHGGTGEGGAADGSGLADATGDSPTRLDGGADAKVDSGADFCAWSHEKAQAMAQHACVWLGACAGNTDLNEYGACYPNALLAYDCGLNPNQQVRGALHAYWDALSRATSCSDVLTAIFAGPPPTCSNSIASCAPDLAGGGGFKDVVTTCADGGFASAVNCQMRGYTCVQGACTNNGAACGTTSTAGCAGNVLHSCQNIENAVGSALVWSDVGRDCTNFGGGRCVAIADGGAYGCLPNGTSTACAPTAAVSCGYADAGAVVTGCATGTVETVRCGDFDPSTNCKPDGGWAASGRNLVGACYSPAEFTGGLGECLPSDGFEDPAGASGVALVGCLDAGFGACVINLANNEPYCPTK